MNEHNELVAVNRECDKKNKFFNITGMTESQIMEISSRFPKEEWLLIRRTKP